MEKEVQVLGIRETLRAFNRLPKEANAALRERTKKLAEVLAGKVRSAGRSSDRQSAAVAVTAKARKDRIPKIVLGGAKRVTSSKTPAHLIFFGAEFGAGSRLRQFRPHLGRVGYWAYPTIRAETEETAKVWQDVLDDVAKEWSRGDISGVV